MIVKIGEKIGLNLQSIMSFQVGGDDDTGEIGVVIHFTNNTTQYLEDKEAKVFMELMNQLLPDIATEEGRNAVINSLVKISNRFHGGK